MSVSEKIRVFLIQDSDKLFFYTYSFAKYVNQLEAFASAQRLATKESGYIIKAVFMTPAEYEGLVNSSPFQNGDNPVAKTKLKIVKEEGKEGL